MPGCSNCSTEPALANNHVDPLFRRILWIALIANAAMFFVEIIASQLGESISLQADALDFLGDALTYGISLAVIGASLRIRTNAALAKAAARDKPSCSIMPSATWSPIACTGFNAVIGS